ncbi:MAG: hypothetical protein WBF87_00730 [Mesorhizobium sp.]
MTIKTILGAIALLMSADMASAQIMGRSYDHNIEQAAIRIAASKMGEIRGGFSLDAKPVFVRPITHNVPTHLGAERKIALMETTASIPSF